MGRKAKGVGLFSKNRVREFREKLGMTQTELAEQSGISGSRLSRIELSKRPVKIDDLKVLAPYLRTTALNLMGDSAPGAEDGGRGGGGNRVETIEVGSYVQAGLWSTHYEWAPEDIFEIKLPKMAAYPNIPRRGSVVRGDSMNRVYPEGSVIIWVPFGEINEPLMVGRRYVLNRHGIDGAIEHTVKTFTRDTEGRDFFVPESDNPEYKPIPLDGPKDYKIEVAGRVFTSIGARAGL